MDTRRLRSGRKSGKGHSHIRLASEMLAAISTATGARVLPHTATAGDRGGQRVGKPMGGNLFCCVHARRTARQKRS